MSYKTLDPDTIPTHADDIAAHRNNPTLVRHYTLNLPDGYSLFYFCSVVLKYDDLSPHVHGTLCHFLEHASYGRYRDATVPRSWFKTSIATIGKSIWLPIRRDPNIRILIAMNTADNAEKRVHVIKNHWETNTLLQQAFPDLVPDFKHTRWSNSCAELKRTRRSEEGTYEAIGSGGAVVSRHYDHIDEDDLVYAKKDDLSGAEIEPNREDIEKAIGWHKLVYSLFSDPAHSTLDNIGTRWAVHDLKDWIFRSERRKFKFFVLAAEKRDSSGAFTGEPVWKERFPREVLTDIRDSQGPYMYSTQYLNLPRDPSDALFHPQWLDYFDSLDSVPRPYNTATFVDLALWGDSKGLARNVILTIARSHDNHLWVLRYDRGKYNPTEVVEHIESHVRMFKSTAYIEEVYYQRAVRHIAKKRMEETGFAYNCFPLKRDASKNAKDLRIKTIQPTASNNMLHVRHGMKELYQEYCDYPSGLTCDILDTIGYATQRKLPRAPDKPKQQTLFNPFSLESILESAAAPKSGDYPFDMQCPIKEQNGKWFL